MNYNKQIIYLCFAVFLANFSVTLQGKLEDSSNRAAAEEERRVAEMRARVAEQEERLRQELARRQEQERELARIQQELQDKQALLQELKNKKKAKKKEINEIQKEEEQLEIEYQQQQEALQSVREKRHILEKALREQDALSANFEANLKGVVCGTIVGSLSVVIHDKIRNVEASRWKRWLKASLVAAPVIAYIYAHMYNKSSVKVAAACYTANFILCKVGKNILSRFNKSSEDSV